MNKAKNLAHRLCLLWIDGFVICFRGLKALGGGGATGKHDQGVGVGLGESIVLAKVRDLLRIFLAFYLLHDVEPIGHFFAITFFDGGEVGFPGRILGHG